SLIARPGAMQPGEDSLFHEAFKILAVGEIAFLALSAEEEPVFAFGSSCLAFLQVGAERGHAGARSDDDDGCIRIFGQMKMLCRAGKRWDGNIVGPLGKKR